MATPKIAIVCEFLTVMGGAENVVLAMHEAFPSAPIYTALYKPEAVPAFNHADVRTSKENYKKYQNSCAKHTGYFQRSQSRHFKNLI